MDDLSTQICSIFPYLNDNTIRLDRNYDEAPSGPEVYGVWYILKREFKFTHPLGPRVIDHQCYRLI